MNNDVLMYSNGFPTHLPAKQKNLFQDCNNLLKQPIAEADKLLLSTVKRLLTEGVLCNRRFRDCAEIVNGIQAFENQLADLAQTEVTGIVSEFAIRNLLPRFDFSVS